MRHTFKRTYAVAALAAAMAAPGILGLAAATASALPISNLASECRQANGGNWTVDYGSNHQIRGYSCYYRDINGNHYVDFYDRRGNYTGTG